MRKALASPIVSILALLLLVLLLVPGRATAPVRAARLVRTSAAAGVVRVTTDNAYVVGDWTVVDTADPSEVARLEITTEDTAAGTFHGTVIPPDNGKAGPAFVDPFQVLDGRVSGDTFSFRLERTGIGGTGPNDRDATYNADWTGTVTGNKASGSINATLEPGTLLSPDGFAGARVFSATRATFELSGTVMAVACGADATTCSTPPAPAPDVTVTATGDDGGSTTTSSDGSYALPLPPGNYTLTPSAEGKTFKPDSLPVDLKADTSNLDFTTCADVPASDTASRTLSSSSGTFFVGIGGCPKMTLDLKMAGATMYFVSWTFPYKCNGKDSLRATGTAGDNAHINQKTGAFYIAMGTAGSFSALVSGTYAGSTVLVDALSIKFDNPSAGCPSMVALKGTLTLAKS